MTEIRLPQYGMGMTDGTITAWHKSEGDRVTKGELLCDIEAAKTMVEMESPESGVLRRIIVKVDENVPVNTIIAEIDAAGVNLEPPVIPAPAAAAAVRPSPESPIPVPPAAAVKPNSGEPGVQVEPSARRAAGELGVDLSTLTGSGPGGRILLKDVHAVAAAATGAGAPVPAAQQVSSPAPAAHQPVSEPPAFSESVHTMTRRTIARRLTESKQQVPHFYLKTSCAVDALHAARKNLKGAGDSSVSINDLIVRAVALALQEVPEMNVSFGEKVMQHHRNVDVAVAVATPRGLVTPIVRSAQVKPVGEIAGELKELVRLAREGKLKPEQYNGGTVTVSNMGMLGVEEFSAIINPPQSAIFAIGAGEPRAIVREGKLDIATLMTVTLSVDHRAVDGAVAAKGLAAFKRLIEIPALLLA